MSQLSPNITARYLVACARHNPDGEAVAQGERRISWRELADGVFALANGLRELGIEHGDKVALLLHNSPEFILTNFGIQAAGAIPVPANYRFTADELAFQLDHSDARVLLYDQRYAEVASRAATRAAGIERLVCHGDRCPAGSLDFATLQRAGSSADPRVPTADEDVAVMVYTGGTTGAPKGVLLTYGAHLDMFARLLAGIMKRGASLELTREQEQRVAETFPLPGVKQMLPLLRRGPVKALLASKATYELNRRALRKILARPELLRFAYGHGSRYFFPSLPLFHDASYQMLMLGLFTGTLSFLLLEEPSFEPRRVLQTIARDQPFFMANVPTGWKKLVQALEREPHDVSSVRVGATGAGVCSAALKRQIMERFPGIILIDLLGQTEMTPLTSFRIDTSPATLKDRAVGESIVQLRIMDDDERELPRGETGEIWYRSPTMMKGYYKDAAATRAATRDGWLRSGDLGYLDHTGELHIVERKSECINTGGEKIFPGEVEQRLLDHPDVEQACVIGVPDEEWGEHIRAVVQPRPGAAPAAEALQDFCRQSLAGYKVPRSIVLVDEIPLSPVGKVQRAKVKERWGSVALS